MSRCIDGWKYRWMYGWMDRCIDGLMYRWMDVMIERWMSGCIGRLLYQGWLPMDRYRVF